MKVLMVHPCKGFYGGAEEVVMQFHRYLLEHGVSCRVVLKSAPEELVGDLYSHGILTGIENVDSYRRMQQGATDQMGWTDIVCCFNFPATLTAFPTKKPIVWYCNEPAELFTNWWRKPIEVFNRWWVKKVGMRCVVADETQAIRFANIYGVEPKVIPYGIDYKFWSQGSGDRIFQILHEKRVGQVRLLQVGTVTPYKNQEASIRALASLKWVNSSIELVLAGSATADKKYCGEMEKLAFDLGVWDSVSFTGQLNQEQIREWYFGSDILLHPVREQGGWLVPFEAMCSDLPVVTTPSFTASSIIRENKLGLVTGNLEYGVKKLLESKENFSHAKEWVKENLTWEKFGESMVKVLEEALS